MSHDEAIDRVAKQADEPRTDGNGDKFRDALNDVARHFFGTPNRALSKGSEMRYGSRGSLSVDIKKGVWRDFETGEGGGVLDLVMREMKFSTRAEAAQWLEDEEFIRNDREPKPKANGKSAGEPNKEVRLHTSGDRHPRFGKPSKIYNYTDESGILRHQNCRFEPKKFRPRQPDGNGGWYWDLDASTTPFKSNPRQTIKTFPYKLPGLIEDVASDYEIHVHESDKTVDRARDLGIRATCSPGGAGSWKADYNKYFAGAKVVVFADNDPQTTNSKTGELLFHPDGRPRFAGRDHMLDVAANLHDVARRVQLVDLGKLWPECPEKGDAYDFLESHSREEYDALVAAAPDYEPSTSSADKEKNGTAGGDAQTDSAPAFSEVAIAINFANKHADDLRYVAKWNQWFCWDGTCWREDEKRKVYSIACELCREVAITANRPGESKRIASAKTRAAVVSLASENPRIAATTDQWDADPWLLNTPGGVVDLRTGQMREHRPGDYMTKQTAVAPAGDCPRWKAFLDEVTAGDRELQAYLQGVSGYCLTASTREQQLFFLYGSGRNGKGVYLQTISGIMGAYHRATSIETFTASQSERHPTELAALRGARLVTAAETEDGRRWAEARIKEMTGGDKITARFMRQDFFEFFPQFKLMFSGNHMPTLRTVNKAITRRFNRVPFAVTIAEEKMNVYLTEELKAEWPGILKWMVQGSLMWQRSGLKAPQAVVAATGQYLESQDVLGEWLAECCELAPGYWESIRELFDKWKPWAEARGEWVGSKNKFSQKLEDRGGFVPQKSEDQKQRGFRGLRLRRPPTTDELVDRWINECCEVGDDLWTDAVRVSKSWQAFIKTQDVEQGVASSMTLEQKLRERGLAYSNGKVPGWRGLRVKGGDDPGDTLV
jgi:putative DNA primase/helicase